MSRRSVGRPPSGSPDARAAILGAAGDAFRDLGFDATTVRSIAGAAGVDPALVLHYFGSKAELFVAAMAIPDEAQSALNVLATMPRESWGGAIADLLLAPDAPFRATLATLIRAAAHEPRAAALIRSFYETQFLQGLRPLDLGQSEARAVLMSSLVAGLVFTGDIVGLAGFTGADLAVRRALLAGTLQAILTVPLPD
jgi:AcrR family transcriptional regulator